MPGTRATRLPVLAQPALGARNLALLVAPERLTKSPERLYLRFALTAMPDRLILFDAAGENRTRSGRHFESRGSLKL